MPTSTSIKELLESGAHFGHQASAWNPQMKSYIFTKRNGIHIIDLEQTVTLLSKACEFVKTVIEEGGTLLFVGTKKQAQESIQNEAGRCGMPYVNQRWLGGTLTNFATIQSRIDYLVRMEDQQSRGEFTRLTKKEAGKMEDEIVRLNRTLGGIKELTKLPSALFVVDPMKEDIAIAEAVRLGIPVVAMVDTNCNPNTVDYPIPSNDDAIRAVKLICTKIADAVLEGKTNQLMVKPEEGEEGSEQSESAEAPENLSFAPDDDEIAEE